MPNLSAEVKLRPTRIGFLVRPTDLRSVRAIMRDCACLWGGIYNPIIPVFRNAPKEWRAQSYTRFKGPAVAKGYVRFFEPDVFVEAEKGLLEEAGLGALREKHTLYPQVMTLKELFKSDGGRNWSEPSFGLNVTDVLSHIYKTDQRFVRRDKLDCLIVKPERNNALVESVFGVYPSTSDREYIRQAYEDVYKPEKVGANPDTWRRVYLKGAQTPLRVTRHGLDPQRYWYHNFLLFVFDPSLATDLIDLWNLRLEPYPVLPIPVHWFESLADEIYDLLKKQYRPVIGNPSGLMHNATIEFSRSISQSTAQSLIRHLKPGLPSGALVIKYWRNPIWVDHRDDRVLRDTRMKIVADERRVDLVVTEDRNLHATFATIEPEFAARYGTGQHRWVNVLNVSNYGNASIATILPFNAFDRTWPRLSTGNVPIAIGTEGWVFPQSFKKSAQYVELLRSDEAIKGSLGRLGVEAALSEPGHIAKQMLEHLGGLRGVNLLADIDTLKLLNKMAGGLRRKRNIDDTVEENFELRSATLKDWIDRIAQIQGKPSLPTKKLSDFTKRNIIRLGLETDCTHCHSKNWSTLTVVDYRITCERCLKSYDFPQASLRAQNRNWTYRVVGPFSVPDYGKGSYGSLLALRLLDQYRSAVDRTTFATAMNFDIDGIQYEVDFVALHTEDRAMDERASPRLIVGEAKSFGTGELITAKELSKLKSIAEKLPQAVVVIAVLRDHFTSREKDILTKFVSWGRRPNVYGEATNPVLLLTSHELTMDYLLSATWKALGGKHEKFADYEHSRTLINLADATQQIYLDIPSIHEVRRQYWNKREISRKQKINRHD